MTTQDSSKQINFPKKFWEILEILKENNFDKKLLEQFFPKELINPIIGIVITALDYTIDKDSMIRFEMLKNHSTIFLEKNYGTKKDTVSIDIGFKEFVGYRYCEEETTLLRLTHCADCNKVELMRDDDCFREKYCCNCAKKYPGNCITMNEYNEIINNYDLTESDKRLLEKLVNLTPKTTKKEWKKVRELLEGLKDYNYLIDRCF
jgi:hypothetical protein